MILTRENCDFKMILTCKNGDFKMRKLVLKFCVLGLKTRQLIVNLKSVINTIFFMVKITIFYRHNLETL